MSSSSTEDETLQEYRKSGAKSGVGDLPAKSRTKYIKTYDIFIQWKTSKGFKNFSQAVFLAYFKELAKTKQASTLWAIYSMLKATVALKHNVQINRFSKLLSFIKSMNKGFISKKTKVWSRQEIETFLKDAPDYNYLAMKVALILGVSGALRSTELVKLRTEDVQKQSDEVMLVNVMQTPKVIDRTFVIRKEYIKIVEKYQALRPPDTETNRLFIYYQNGKCTRRAIGRHSIADFPKKIASFLDLPNPEKYTGHCMRASAKRLAKSGADLVICRQIGTNSNATANQVEESGDQRLRLDPTWRPSPHLTPLWSVSRDVTHRHDSPVNVMKAIKIQPSESSFDEAPQLKTRSSKSANEAQFIKTDNDNDDDDPFDLIPEEYEMLASPAARPKSTEPRRPRPFLLSVRQLAALERRRLRLDEVRARQLHARETERLRIEARRVEVDAERSAVLNQIADVAAAWLERLKANGRGAPRY